MNGRENSNSNSNINTAAQHSNCTATAQSKKARRKTASLLLNLHLTLATMKIEGNVFAVTGGASGLGEGTARMIIENKGKVIILDMNEENGERIASELGEDAAFVKMNLLKEKSIAEAVQAAHAKWGRIDGLISCAGVGSGKKIVSRKGKPHDMKTFEIVLRINLIGLFSVVSKCAALMTQNEPNGDGERGIIINVASVAAFEGQNGQVAYSASKGGVVSMTLPIARDLGKLGIRINTICPGIMATPMTAGFETPAGERVGNSLKKAQIFPTHRFGVPAEFAMLAKLMIENPIMNAESVRLDGGIRMPKL